MELFEAGPDLLKAQAQPAAEKPGCSISGNANKR